MITIVLKVFAEIVRAIATLLPVGPDIPQSVADIVAGAVATAKGLDPLVGSSHALVCIITIALYEIGYAGFRAVVWTYGRVRSG